MRLFMFTTFEARELREKLLLIIKVKIVTVFLFRFRFLWFGSERCFAFIERHPSYATEALKRHLSNKSKITHCEGKLLIQWTTTEEGKRRGFAFSKFTLRGKGKRHNSKSLNYRKAREREREREKRVALQTLFILFSSIFLRFF